MPAQSNPQDSYAWYCIRTQPKRENLAAQGLKQHKNIQAFCPKLKYRKATRRGKIWWVEAMFPGYVFAFFSRKESERIVIHTHGVMKLIKFGNHVPEIPCSFIAKMIQEMEAQEGGDGDTLILQPTIKQGDEVEIANGAMQGIHGKVLEVLTSTERVKLLIEFLGNDHIVDADLFALFLPDKPIPE